MSPVSCVFAVHFAACNTHELLVHPKSPFISFFPQQRPAGNPKSFGIQGVEAEAQLPYVLGTEIENKK
jgi:hypothetical protein